jgi:galactosyl transferase GMA12/MNN10 family
VQSTCAREVALGVCAVAKRLQLGRRWQAAHAATHRDSSDRARLHAWHKLNGHSASPEFAQTTVFAHAGVAEGASVDMLEAVWSNRAAYAARRGYALIDGSQHIPDKAPAPWHSIKAVEAVLDDFDWVLYLDADVWITNVDFALEAVLPAPGEGDLVVSGAAGGADAWAVRRTSWSRGLLVDWWAKAKSCSVRLYTDGDGRVQRRLRQCTWHATRDCYLR